MHKRLEDFSMSVHTPAYAANTEGIRPDVLYPLQAFIRASGVSKTKMREARLMGLPLPVLELGKRLYVRGAEGIAWIEALSVRLAEVETAK
jgi:hypothetical protein